LDRVEAEADDPAAALLGMTAEDYRRALDDVTCACLHRVDRASPPWGWPR